MTDDGRRTRRWSEWRQLRMRRLLAALLVGAAVVVGLTALRPAPEPTRQVVVAARDVPAGHRLRAADLTVEAWPEDLSPGDRAARGELTGHRVLGPISAGEPVTKGRLLIGRNLHTPSGTDLVVSVPLADPGLSRLLRAGDRVEVLDRQGAAAARSATVVAVVPADRGAGWKNTSAPAAMVAVSRSEAARIARAKTIGAGGSSALMVAWSAESSDDG